MPGVGEVQFVARLLDHPDDERPPVDRCHVRRDVAPTEFVGERLQPVEIHPLARERDHQVLVEQLEDPLDVVGRLRPGDVDATYDRSTRPAEAFHRHFFHAHAHRSTLPVDVSRRRRPDRGPRGHVAPSFLLDVLN